MTYADINRVLALVKEEYHWKRTQGPHWYIFSFQLQDQDRMLWLMWQILYLRFPHVLDSTFWMRGRQSICDFFPHGVLGIFGDPCNCGDMSVAPDILSENSDRPSQNGVVELPVHWFPVGLGHQVFQRASAQIFLRSPPLCHDSSSQGHPSSTVVLCVCSSQVRCPQLS